MTSKQSSGSTKRCVRDSTSHVELQSDKVKIAFSSKEKKVISVISNVEYFLRVECRVCHRKFNPNRLDVHVAICEKVFNKNRPVFDSRKHRLKGTPLQAYLPLILRRLREPKMQYTQWRQKHEEFIRAMREGRRVQSYISRGYDLSKLPPPTPSLNPYYIRCCYCLRRFAPKVAERHIPKCQYIECNKPHLKEPKTNREPDLSKSRTKRDPSPSKKPTRRNMVHSKKSSIGCPCKCLSKCCKRLRKKSDELLKIADDFNSLLSTSTSETVIYRDTDFIPFCFCASSVASNKDFHRNREISEIKYLHCTQTSHLLDYDKNLQQTENIERSFLSKRQNDNCQFRPQRNSTMITHTKPIKSRSKILLLTNGDRIQRDILIKYCDYKCKSSPEQQSQMDFTGKPHENEATNSDFGSSSVQGDKSEMSSVRHRPAQFNCEREKAKLSSIPPISRMQTADTEYYLRS
ncbi:uncharacterized protein LOC111640300 [Centruroides sculpturatus]|uniref:uncharacterized protein LOC111640300 n=1 Tax=Centruroides sculpturatus TaxID=218467 RepID=UPI000C6E96AC|nr:uncharacterized protein LOC111640300 [Centruroides sculpturatus]